MTIEDKILMFFYRRARMFIDREYDIFELPLFMFDFSVFMAVRIMLAIFPIKRDRGVNTIK